MYKLSGNKKITHSHHYETSNRITLENKSTVHADGTINTGSSAGRILIVDDDPDITLSFSIGLEDGGFEIYALQFLHNPATESFVLFFFYVQLDSSADSHIQGCVLHG
jgi:hypothetical protein